MPATSLEGLIDYARRYVAEHVPGRAAVHLTLDLDFGKPVKHPVPLCGPPASLAAATSERLTELEADVLQAVAELGGEPRGQAIAAQVGMAYESGLKSALSALRRRLLLGGAEKAAGYPLTEKGRAMLEAARPAELPPGEGA